jgi:hypothetical protein
LGSRLSNVAGSALAALPSALVFDNFSVIYSSYFFNLTPAPASLPTESGSSDSTYSVVSADAQSVLEHATSGLEERSSDQRFMRFMNPVFKYDFKVGNYLPDDAKKLNPHLFATIKDITTGIRKAS